MAGSRRLLTTIKPIISITVNTITEHITGITIVMLSKPNGSLSDSGDTVPIVRSGQGLDTYLNSFINVLNCKLIFQVYKTYAYNFIYWCFGEFEPYLHFILNLPVPYWTRITEIFFTFICN